MSRTMSRWAFLRAAALAVLAAAGGWMPLAPTAEAAPKSSPFAGVYVGRFSRGYLITWNVSISGSGQVVGSADGISYVGPYTGSFSGRVGSDGSLSVGGTDTTEFTAAWGVVAHTVTERFRVKAHLALDVAGNIVGVDDEYGQPFTWTRQ